MRRGSQFCLRWTFICLRCGKSQRCVLIIFACVTVLLLTQVIIYRQRRLSLVLPPSPYGLDFGSSPSFASNYCRPLEPDDPCLACPKRPSVPGQGLGFMTLENRNVGSIKNMDPHRFSKDVCFAARKNENGNLCLGQYSFSCQRLRSVLDWLGLDVQWRSLRQQPEIIETVFVTAASDNNWQNLLRLIKSCLKYYRHNKLLVFDTGLHWWQINQLKLVRNVKLLAFERRRIASFLPREDRYFDSLLKTDQYNVLKYFMLLECLKYHNNVIWIEPHLEWLRSRAFDGTGPNEGMTLLGTQFGIQEKRAVSLKSLFTYIPPPNGAFQLPTKFTDDLLVHVRRDVTSQYFFKLFICCLLTENCFGELHKTYGTSGPAVLANILLDLFKDQSIKAKGQSWFQRKRFISIGGRKQSINFEPSNCESLCTVLTLTGAVLLFGVLIGLTFLLVISIV